MMKRGTMTKVFAAAMAAALSLSSCQEFFTSSLGAWAERDASVPDNLTASQALSIADTALVNSDTDLAAALLPQLAAMATTGTPSAEIVEAAVDTAVLASGVSEAFGEALAAVGTDVIEGGGSLTAAQIDTLCALLASITVTADALDVFTYLEGQPAATMAAAGVSAADYAMAAAALLIAEVGDAATLSTLIQNKLTGYTKGTNATLASALVSDASAQWPDDPLLDAMTSMFDAL